MLMVLARRNSETKAHHNLRTQCKSSTTVGRGFARRCVQHNSSDDGPDTLRWSTAHASVFLARLGWEEVSPLSMLGDVPFFTSRWFTERLYRNHWL